MVTIIVLPWLVIELTRFQLNALILCTVYKGFEIGQNQNNQVIISSQLATVYQLAQSKKLL